MLHVAGLATFTLCLLAPVSERSVHGLQLPSGWKLVLGDGELDGPGARAGSATWTDQKGLVWMFGGRGAHPNDPNGTQLQRDLWTLDARLKTWRRVVAPGDGEAASGRELASMCGTGDGRTVVVFGGRTEGGAAVDQMLVLQSDVPRRWQSWKCAPCPPPRYDALSWCDEQAAEMWLVGGYGADGRQLRDSWRLTLGNLSWSRAPPPDVECAWTAANASRVPQPFVLLWRSADGALHLMCDRQTYLNDSADDHDDPNLQLWRRLPPDPGWRLVAESSHGATMWPGMHRHGGTCGASGGTLWLFGGQSDIGSHRYLNNDVWAYDARAGAWSKAELLSDGIALEPEQRHLAASWCVGDAMFVYGGSVCGDDDMTRDCIRGDLWMLNVSAVPRQNDIGVKKTNLNNTTTASKTAVGPRAPDPHPLQITSNAIPPEGTSASAVPPTAPSSSAPSEGALGDVVDQPTRQEVQEMPDLHGAYGSIIFFGITLSMFALSGVVIFFRRCVSCPPRNNVLLKEPPPVRYTVITDESYTI